jgi:putative two-component system response regulator
MALTAAGFSAIDSASNGLEAIAYCQKSLPDLILLDLHMPQMDGYQTLEELRPLRKDFLPVLVFTADSSLTARRRALDLGASDFLTKPGDVLEIGLRVRNFLHMGRLFHATQNQRDLLEAKVKERTKDLNELHVEILARLAMAGEFRDDETGEHTKRVSDLSGRIAKSAGLPDEDVNLIRYGSLLHDVGKIGIPDAILRKRGPLLPDEYDRMKEHTEIGGRLLANSKSPFLKVAHEIAMTHHERWDGTGYPRGLAGENIPISGRVVAIADAYDAMTANRVYKDAIPLMDAVAEIVRCTGSHFDPTLVRAFMGLMADEMVRSRAA